MCCQIPIDSPFSTSSDGKEKESWSQLLVLRNKYFCLFNGAPCMNSHRKNNLFHDADREKRMHFVSDTYDFSQVNRKIGKPRRCQSFDLFSCVCTDRGDFFFFFDIFPIQWVLVESRRSVQLQPIRCWTWFFTQSISTFMTWEICRWWAKQHLAQHENAQFISIRNVKLWTKCKM